jgi:D-alanine--D-alanine ligase
MTYSTPCKELKIALLFGGPSRERGISLNSARSCLDHLQPLLIDLSLFYLHPTGLFYQLSSTELYSNTPADFDFKLALQKEGLKEEELAKHLKKVDLVFPLIHGAYGEDGSLQRLLKAHQIPFVGSQSDVCQKMFNKYKAHKWLQEHQFQTVPTLCIQSVDARVAPFWNEHKLKKAVVKPTMSGSSIGIKVADCQKSAERAIKELWEEGFHELMLEPFSEDTEFTVCVLEHAGAPVALIPLEIDIQKEGIFDYRKKYLPSPKTRYYCPPRFPKEIVSQIRNEAERLFQVFGIQGYTRIDGWIDQNGAIRFSDLNPISGMEQNSFLFQQAARVGLSHSDLLEYLLNQTLLRYGKSRVNRRSKIEKEKKPIYVLMGGNTSERQVSLLSGTNVWLKLLQTNRYEPNAFLLDQEEKIWQLPYDFALHHTVEEMTEHCKKAEKLIKGIDPLVSEIRKRLQLPPLFQRQRPIVMDMKTFLKQAKQKRAFVFLGLHGGSGENGTLQKRLEKYNIAFNGSRSAASKLCMNKHQTAKKIRSLNQPQILAMSQLVVHLEENPHTLWKKAVKKLKTENLLIKPQKDGCSTGVVRLTKEAELTQYLELCRQRKLQAPAGLFQHHPHPIEMPGGEQTAFLLEPFIETDRVYALQTELHYQKISGWCEMTIGVLEKGGKYQALNPSLTLALNHILSVEEKFQGGTGINITPPPEYILSSSARKQIQQNACEAAKALGIQGYGRIDLFVECETGAIRVIEANTLPALTPSTVLYHQALAERPPIAPQELLIQLIESP